jgi:hypothetical protein
LGLKENVIIGKLIPAATGMGRYRTIRIKTDGEEEDTFMEVIEHAIPDVEIFGEPAETFMEEGPSLLGVVEVDGEISSAETEEEPYMSADVDIEEED